MKKSGLEGHMRRIEAILREYRFIAGDEDDILPGYYQRVMAIVLQSFRLVPEIYAEVENSLELQLPFAELKENLFSLFNDRSSLQLHLQAELSALKLHRPYVRFVQELRRIFRLHQRVYANGSTVQLLEFIVGSVPRSVSLRLAKEIGSIDQCAIPFDSEGPETTVLSVLKAALREQELIEDMDARIKSVKPADRVKRSGESAHPPRGQWLEEWVRKFSRVVKCWGVDHYEELRALEEADATVEVRYIPRRDNRPPYAFLGLKSGTVPPLKCSHKDFVLRESESSASKN